MKRWEHEIVRCHNVDPQAIRDAMEPYSLGGWELVNVHIVPHVGAMLFFKRPAEQKP